MANRFFNPNEQFCDATGLPYAGGSLAFYASGTSSPLNTYSDSALTIANTNPVVLDSAGRAGSVFLQNLAYKVVLSDVNSNQIWTEDPVFSSDYSTRAVFTSGAGSPNGSVAGTAGSTGIGASVYWDDVNFILYVCTQTGTTSTAVWTAVNATTAAAVVPAPQGYLTPTSGTPLITSDVISNTSLVYTPYVGDLVPIYNGAGLVPTVFSELTLTLSASQAASTIYDVFVFNNSGVLTLVTGPAWTTSTAGSGARGTGAATTQLSRLSGIWVNTVSISGRNASTTYSIPANQATYLGSIYIDATPGQISFNVSYGQARKWAIWNAYNRQPILLVEGDTTASWSYTTNAWRQANAAGNTNNYIDVFSGLPEESYTLEYVDTTNNVLGTGTTTVPAIGIGYNSTSSPSGLTGQVELSQNSGGNIQVGFELYAKYLAPKSIGVNRAYPLENGRSSTAAAFFGSSASMQFIATWRG